MKTLTLVAAMALCLFAFSAFSSEPVLWALDVGPWWGTHGGLGSVIEMGPFATSEAAYPPGWNYLMDASYDVSNSILYVSGGFSTSPNWWTQNTIGVYSGGPGGLEFVSSSNAGMGGDDGYHWLGGIAHMDGSLYAIGFTGFEEDDVLLRIDNPGTAAQTVTQVGPQLGTTSSLGIPFNLCTDGQGSLLSIFRPSSFGGSTDSTLYRIDPQTGGMTALHTYPDSLIDGYVEGLTLCGDSLYGFNTDGRVFRFDLGTYEGTVLGVLEPSSTWTGLVTIPEPSAVGALGLALIFAAMWRRRRSR